MKRKVLARTLLLVVATMALACSQAAPNPSDSATSGAASADKSPQEAGRGAVAVEVANATSFHVLDYVAWNNHDLDVFRRLHSADVKVDFGGAKTKGIDAHVKALEPVWPATSLITNHRPVIAEGEWTCMVGTFAPTTSSKMVTVAKWRDGAISEEYLLAKTAQARPGKTGGERVADG